MGFVSLVGAVWCLAFVGNHQFFPSSLQGHCCGYRCRTTCHEASTDGSNNEQRTTLSSNNNRTTSAKCNVGRSTTDKGTESDPNEADNNIEKNDLISLGVASAPPERKTLTDEKRRQIQQALGVDSARKQGHYTRYPGVCFRKDTGTWRVIFSYKGKVYCAGSSYATEEEAALAHDAFVRRKKMNRPLHFPMDGEPSSLVVSKLELIPIEELQQLRSEDSIRAVSKLGHKTRYPGVIFHKVSQKWQVSFTFKGKKYYGGLYETEEEAALAHDEFVRKREMKRPLHFPREGERTSYAEDPGDT